LEAQKGKYAVGSFNTSDLEITRAIILAAAKLKSPVIIETSEKAIAYAGIENLADIIKNEAKKAIIPVALHLDHGRSLDIIRQALAVGYSSVMFDGSHLSFQENIILTEQAAAMAHRAGVTCEGELGAIGKAGAEKQMTNPGQIVEFVRETGIDLLATSFGSAHGAGDEHLDINLLKKIRAKTTLPLVLHGGSGLKDEDVKEAIKIGICKINIDTDIRHTFSRAVREIPQQMSTENDPRIIMTKVMVEIQKLIEAKIKLFGSVEKA
jgi:fructose-bisphosphate aldolase class II